MKYTDFLDDNAKAIHAFLSNDNYSFKDIALALNLDEAAKLTVQRISLLTFPPQTDSEGKRKMRRLTGNDMLAFCVAYSLVQRGVINHSDVVDVFTTLSNRIDGNCEFSRNGDVLLSQAPTKAVEVLQLAYPLAQVWYHPHTMLIRSSLLTSEASIWVMDEPPIDAEVPVTVAVLANLLTPIIGRLQSKYVIPVVDSSVMIRLAVVMP